MNICVLGLLVLVCSSLISRMLKFIVRIVSIVIGISSFWFMNGVVSSRVMLMFIRFFNSCVRGGDCFGRFRKCRVNREGRSISSGSR